MIRLRNAWRLLVSTHPAGTGRVRAPHPNPLELYYRQREEKHVAMCRWSSTKGGGVAGCHKNCHKRGSEHSSGGGFCSKLRISTGGLEPPTFGFGGRRSIQLSYADEAESISHALPPSNLRRGLFFSKGFLDPGINPAYIAWLCLFRRDGVPSGTGRRP